MKLKQIIRALAWESERRLSSSSHLSVAKKLLYEAAVVILTRVKRASPLKEWAQAIAKRSGVGKARVALARKLSVILHSIWRSGEPFRWAEQPAGA